MQTTQATSPAPANRDHQQQVEHAGGNAASAHGTRTVQGLVLLVKGHPIQRQVAVCHLAGQRGCDGEQADWQRGGKTGWGQADTPVLCECMSDQMANTLHVWRVVSSSYSMATTETKCLRPAPQTTHWSFSPQVARMELMQPAMRDIARPHSRANWKETIQQ